jgi:hypothetical protein
MIRNFISFFIACFFGMISHAQVGVGTTTPQAALDVSSTTKGILIPRMTTAQRNAISSPQVSTLVFDTDLGDFYTYTSSGWLALVPKPSSKINQVFSKSSSQYFASGTDITWDQRAGQGTALSYSGATVTLPANKTFMIIGYLSNTYYATGVQYHYQYRVVKSSDNSTTDFVYSTRGHTFIQAQNMDGVDGGTPAFAVINTGSSGQSIKLRVVNATGFGIPSTTSDNGPKTTLIIQEL